MANRFFSYFFLQGRLGLGLIAGVLILGACASSKKNVLDPGPTGTLTRTGDSYETAVIILQTSEEEGVDAEYEWLGIHYPGYAAKKQSLIIYKKEPYDVLDIQTRNGEDKIIYFDISHFYKKL